MNTAKRISSYVLASMVLVMTIIALLGIWEIIDLREVLSKILYSLFVIFVASVLVLFIFSVLFRDSDNTPRNN